MSFVPPALDFKSPSVWIATWFGSGLMRPAPGTWGSLAAMPFGILILYFSSPYILALSAIALYFIGLMAVKKVLTGSDSDHDPSYVVVDEVVGQWIALIPVLLTPAYAVLAFALFRFFDAVKPWPVSYFDRHVPGACGVMMDDVVAGVLAAFCILGVRYFGLL